MTALISLAAGWAGTRLALAVARRFGIVSRPNPLVPQHREPVAYLGGAGVALGIVAASAVLGTSWPAGSAAGAAALLAVGLIDDLRPLRPLAKVAAQGAGAALAVGLSPVSLTGAAALDAGLAVAWIVLIVNAVNVTDVCDGLVGGLAATSLLFVGWSSSSEPAWIAAWATVGFLRFNAPPARIFLGDAGSLLLGFLLADLSLRTFGGAGLVAAGPILLLVVAVPLFEVAFLVTKRTQRGVPWWLGSSDHFALRMQAAGFSKWRTDLTAWGLAAVACGAAAGWASGAWWGPILVVATLVAATGAWRKLTRWGPVGRGTS